MSDEIVTVQFAAERLKIHPKTVLRFIREGRLRATRMGKSYRIASADLDAFAGVPVRTRSPAEVVSVTCVVDVPDVSPELARKWARVVGNALQARPKGAPMHAQVIAEPERAHLKIVMTGGPGDVVNLLSLIRVWIEQLRA